MLSIRCFNVAGLNFVFLLGNIDSQAKLFATSDVESQTVVVRRGEEVDDPAKGAVDAGLRWCATSLLNHHTPMNQIHPAQMYKPINLEKLYVQTHAKRLN